MEVPANLQVFITEREVRSRVEALGAEIRAACSSVDLLTVVCVLKGSAIFFADLIRVLGLPVECEFIAVSSYGKATRSSGEVKLNLDITSPLENKHILLVEDIVDSGLTIRFLMDLLRVRHPASLRVCTLLDKPSARKVEVRADFVGFSIPNEFVVGYGLDYGQRYRELPYIARLIQSEAASEAQF